MAVVASDTLPVAAPEDLVRVRRRVREEAIQLGFTIVDQTKLVTAASELARNTLDHGGGGRVHVEVLNGPRSGLRLVFEDDGPGIRDVEEALRDGFTTGTGLGLGLGGARRLVNQLDIDSRVGEGTRVVAVRWS